MDKLNITPTPWRIKDVPIGFGFITVEDGSSFPIANTMAFSTGKEAQEMHRKWDANNAEAIVKAVNGTYGCGINPESVQYLLLACKTAYEELTFGGDWKNAKKVIESAIEKAKL